MTDVEVGVYNEGVEPWHKHSLWVTDALGRHWQLWRIWKNKLQFVMFTNDAAHMAQTMQVSFDPNDPLRKLLETHIQKYAFMFTDPLPVVHTDDITTQVNLPWEKVVGYNEEIRRMVKYHAL